MKQSIHHQGLVVALIAGMLPIGGAEARQFPNIGGALNRAINAVRNPNAPPEDPQAQQQNRNGNLACAGGGVLGGVLGSSLFRGNRFIGGMIGGLAGCLVAREVARELTKNEQQELARRTEASFDSERTYTTYHSQDTGKEVVISRGQEVTQQHDVELESLQDVRPPESGDFVVIGRTYYAKTTVRLRSEPGEGGTVIGGFRKGQAVLIMGRTRDGQWNMVGAGGVLVGYAAADLFLAHRPAAAIAKHSPHAKSEPAAEPPSSSKPESPELANGGTLDAQAKTKVKIAAETSCAQAQQQVGTAKGVVTGCKSPNGGWNVI